MQLTTVLLFCGLSFLFQSIMLSLGAIVTVAYCAGLAWWHEELEFVPRWGQDWSAYRRNVRSWIPSWKPWRKQPARLYVAGSCEICSSVRDWFKSRSPVELIIVSAESHPTRDLNRITYSDGGFEEEGMAAVGRALEHLNLAWAMLGFFFRLPVVNPLLQIFCDAVIAGPRTVRRAACRR